MTDTYTLIGTEINGYTILRHLDQGGMADVYIAHHTGLERDVAMKVLLPTYLDNRTFVERFQREAKAMAKLDHPNIVHVYDTGTLPDGRPYFTMQLVPGGTLESRLEKLAAARQMLTVPYALAIARQVAAALQVAHGAGIIHRDLKPSNILLDAQGKPILTDLGIAFVQDDRRLTRTDIILGTPHYMSPEQARGIALDGRSDIYSLGVVLYEMLAGQRPFDADSHMAILVQHLSEVPVPVGKARPGISKATEQMLARCLEKDPAKRYQSAAELVAALDNTLQQEKATGLLTASGEWAGVATDAAAFITARKEQLPSAHLRKPVKQNKSMGWVFGGVATVILGAVALLAFSGAFSPTSSPTQTQLATVIVTVVAQATTNAEAQATSTLRAAAESDQSEQATRVVPTLTRTRSRPTATRLATATSLSRAGDLSAIVSRNVFSRSGPGMEFEVAGSLERGVSVRLLGRDQSGSWYLIQPAGKIASWLNVDYLQADAGQLGNVVIAVTIPSLSTTATPGSTPVSTASGSQTGNATAATPAPANSIVAPTPTPSRPASTSVPTPLPPTSTPTPEPYIVQPTITPLPYVPLPPPTWTPRPPVYPYP